MDEGVSQSQNDNHQAHPHALFPGDKFKEGEIIKDDSLTTIDIQEMERVRLSLQSMLKSSEHYLRDDQVSPQDLQRPDADKRRQGSGYQDSFTSIATADLLNNYVNIDKKEAAPIVSDSTRYDENSDSVRRSHAKYDKSLLLENTLLNETLEKERYKRKHCEQQIKALQSKLLETQQELAVSVSGERKKDVVINQLDKTMARVVEDWKKHEQEKRDALTQLEEQRQRDQQAQQRQQEMLTNFEKDLSQAVEALFKEQQRAANAEQEKDSQISSILQERDELLQLLEEEREKTASLETKSHDLEHRANRADESRRFLDQEKITWEKERAELECKIHLITQAHADDLENEKKLVEHEKQVAEDSQRVLGAVQKEVLQLTAALDTCNREKENLKTEMTLLAAKFEAQKTRLDSEHRAELERQLSKNLRDLQNQQSRNEDEMRSAHKKQIEDITKKYKSDLENQLNHFHQLRERDRTLKETNEEYEERLSKAHDELVKISGEREALRNDKHNMVVRLQKMMRVHCEEALSLLGPNMECGSKPFGNYHKDTAWKPIQTPAPVTSASHIGLVRGSAQGLSSFVTPTTQRNATASSAPAENSRIPDLYSSQHWTHSDAFGLHDEESEQTWIRLPAMVSDRARTAKMARSTGHVTSDQSHPPYPQTRESRDITGETTKNPYGGDSSPEEPNSAEKDLSNEQSSSTTYESLTEETVREEHFGRPNQPLNLSSDVLMMLQQQQSRQNELNHYVRQLLKKSPSNASGGEMAESTAPATVLPDVSSEPIISPVKEDLNTDSTRTLSTNSRNAVDRSSTSDFSNYKPGNTKQAAFKKSAATPRKIFPSSKIPVVQTPPSKENPSGKDVSTGKPVLTPEQVGQLARLIQMYQKDHDDNDLPSPQRMFQYLRDVQIKSETERKKKHVQSRTGSSNNFEHQATELTQPTKKDSKAKRRLDVHSQSSRLKTIASQSDLTSRQDDLISPPRKSLSEEDARRPARTTLTSESDITGVRNLENRSNKNKKSFVMKPPKRPSVKGVKAWK